MDSASKPTTMISFIFKLTFVCFFSHQVDFGQCTSPRFSTALDGILKYGLSSYLRNIFLLGNDVFLSPEGTLIYNPLQNLKFYDDRDSHLHLYFITAIFGLSILYLVYKAFGCVMRLFANCTCKANSKGCEMFEKGIQIYLLYIVFNLPYALEKSMMKSGVIAKSSLISASRFEGYYLDFAILFMVYVLGNIPFPLSSYVILGLINLFDLFFPVGHLFADAIMAQSLPKVSDATFTTPVVSSLEFASNSEVIDNENASKKDNLVIRKPNDHSIDSYLYIWIGFATVLFVLRNTKV